MAKGFKFKLQSVLEHKIRTEEDEKRKFAEVTQMQAREEQRLEQLKQKRVALAALMKQKQREGGINITELQMYARGMEKLKNDIISQEIRLKEIAIMVDAQRQKLIEATQQKKIYEKLKEKQQQAFIDEENYKEMQMIDELATLKYAGKKSKES